MVEGIERFREAMADFADNYIIIGGTKIISNQLGYISHGEYLKNGFMPDKWFEV